MFGAALIWGSSFFLVKNAVDTLAPNILLGFRFTIGSLLLSVIFWKRLKKIDKDYIIKGTITGVFLFIAFNMQTIGITQTTPGKNAFLTAVYCIIVPFLFWAVEKLQPDRHHFVAAGVCIVGIGLVSLTSDFTIQLGDAFSLVGGFFFAAHIVAVARFTKEKDPILITILQFATAAVISWTLGLLYEPLPVVWNQSVVFGLLYLSVFATTVGLLLQNIGQKYVYPATAAIILSLESVFGVLFSIIFYGERLTLRLVVGFIIIFAAIIVSETKLSFLSEKCLLLPSEEEAVG
jgi:drug/metabolite transporter (DMT)-like permease